MSLLGPHEYWMLICLGLVLLVYAGIFLLGASFRAQGPDTYSLASKNLFTFAAAAVLVLLTEVAVMWVRDADYLKMSISYAMQTGNLNRFMVHLAFHMVSCTVAAAIVINVFEKPLKLIQSFIIISIMSFIIHPLFGIWAWGDVLGSVHGWLQEMGFVDFSGSLVIFGLGGWVALVFVLLRGIHSKKLVSVHHNEVKNTRAAVIAVSILFLGWFGLVGGRYFQNIYWKDMIVGNILMAAFGGGVAAYLLSKTLNQACFVRKTSYGIFAALVAVSASFHVVTSTQAFFIGAYAAVLMMMVERMLEKLGFEDKMGVIAVCVLPGIWGTLAVGLFGDLSVLGTGLERWGQLKIQFLGVVTCAYVTLGVSLPVFLILQCFYRFPLDEELEVEIRAEGSSADFDEKKVLQGKEKTDEVFSQMPMLCTELMKKHYDSMEETRTLLEATSDGILILDLKGRIDRVNDKALWMLGGKKTELIGESISVFFPDEEGPGRSSEILALILSSLHKGKSWRVDKIYLEDVHKQAFPAFFMSSPLRNASDEIVGAIVVFRDLTQMIEKEKLWTQRVKGLEEQCDALRLNLQHLKESCSQSQQETVKSFSYEFKSLIMIIGGYVHQLMQRKDLNDGVKSQLDEIYDSTKRATQIVNELMDVNQKDISRAASSLLDEKTRKDPKKPQNDKERLLLVEDEEAIRKLISRSLKRQGYDVLEASNGQEALDLLAKCRQPVDLFISDIVMPEMNGRELHQRIQEKYPEMKGILMSGYTDDKVVKQEIAEQRIPFMHKPFMQQELIHLVSDVLDESRMN